jgi:hypothetical protein
VRILRFSAAQAEKKHISYAPTAIKNGHLADALRGDNLRKNSDQYRYKLST